MTRSSLVRTFALVTAVLVGPSAFAQGSDPVPAIPNQPPPPVPAAVLVPSKNLLTRAQLRRGDKVQNPGRMTDGTLPAEGDVWNSDFTAILGVGGVAEWDLGSSMFINAARISADNNESYFVEISEDGETFVPLWKAPDAEGAGMRSRQIGPIEGKGRYIRLHAEGGDEMYSVGELELFASAADLDAAGTRRAAPAPPPPPPAFNSTWLVVVGAAALVFWFLRRKVTPAAAAAAEPVKPEAPKEEPPKDEPPKG